MNYDYWLFRDALHCYWCFPLRFPVKLLDWDWPNVLVSNLKIINGTIKTSIFLESTDLQQFIEAIIRVPGQLKTYVISAWSWNSRSQIAHFDHVFQLLPIIKTTFNGPSSHLTISMNCWRRPLSKTMLISIVPLILFELETKTFGQSQSNTTLLACRYL